MDTIKIMNGSIWVFAVILIAMVIVQSLMFLRLALNYNKKHQVLTRAEVNQATKTGAVSAVGPAFSTLTIALSLIVMVGSGATFMRCGVIGAPVWELMMAQFSASAAGVEFGSAAFTPAIFTLCLFGMTLASTPYFLNTMITLKPLDKALVKSQKKENGRSFMPYMSSAAMMGLLGYSIVDYFGNVASIVAGIVAGIVMFLIGKLAKKLKNNTLSSFSMAIAMIFAMIAGQIVTVMMG